MFVRSLFIEGNTNWVIQNTVGVFQNMNTGGNLLDTTNVTVYPMGEGNWLITASCESKENRDDIMIRNAMNRILQEYRLYHEAKNISYADSKTQDSLKRQFLQDISACESGALYSFSGLPDFVSEEMLSGFSMESSQPYERANEDAPIEEEEVDYIEQLSMEAAAPIAEPEMTSSVKEEPLEAVPELPKEEVAPINVPTTQEPTIPRPIEEMLEKITEKYGSVDAFLDKIQFLENTVLTLSKRLENVSPVVEAPAEEVQPATEPTVEPEHTPEEPVEAPVPHKIIDSSDAVEEVTGEETAPNEIVEETTVDSPVEDHVGIEEQPTEESDSDSKEPETATESLHGEDLFYHFVEESHNDAELWAKMIAEKQEMPAHILELGTNQNLYEKYKHGNQVFHDFQTAIHRQMDLV